LLKFPLGRPCVSRCGGVALVEPVDAQLVASDAASDAQSNDKRRRGNLISVPSELRTRLAIEAEGCEEFLSGFS